MRPVLVTARLLVVLMSMVDSAIWTPKEMCETKYQAEGCRIELDPGWYQFGPNRCVKAFFNNARLSHSDAKSTCRKYPNGDLVSIHSEIELEQVECAMYTVTTKRDHYWIGLQRASSKEKFRWTDGSDSDYFKWSHRQPDNLSGKENCAEMNYGKWGEWNDNNCNDKNLYVCQVQLT